MKQTTLIQSRLFGALKADAGKIVRLPHGIAGLPATLSGKGGEYLLHEDSSTRPIQWLVSMEPDGPELPVVDPSLFEPAYTAQRLGISAEVLDSVGAESLGEAGLLAVVAVPKALEHMSMDLRTPLLVNRRTGQGIQLGGPEFRKWPVRRPIWHDLADTLGMPGDAVRCHVVELSPEQAVDIGAGIVVRASQTADGAVRLLVMGPGSQDLVRGDALAVPAAQNQLAAQMDAGRVDILAALHGAESRTAGGHVAARNPETISYSAIVPDGKDEDIHCEVPMRWMLVDCGAGGEVAV